METPNAGNSSVFESVIEYNKYLVDGLCKIELKDYFAKVHELFFNDVDISFMDYFLSICNQEDEFIIPQEKLKEYGVVNNIDTSKDIKRCLEHCWLKSDTDYLLGNVAQSRFVGQHGGNNCYFFS